MNDKITRQQIIARLKENGLRYGELALQNGVSILVTQPGGRVFGPCVPEKA